MKTFFYFRKQNTSKNKSFSRNSLPEFEKSNSFKRALFLSPDEDDDDGPTKRRKLSVSSQNSLVSNSSKSILQDNSKSIWLSQQDFDTSSSKRRKRLESRERSGSWPRRALTFTDKELCKNEESIAANTKVMSEIQLSLHHKTVGFHFWLSNF